jgi:phospholipid/cholesterol/gamma-HCH transport system ATP-binding protein
VSIAAGDDAAVDPVHIRVIGVEKAYGDSKILHGVTLDVVRGQTNVIIGASGSGKTVLMRQMIRLEKPDAGQIIVDGEDMVPMGDVALGRVRKKFGMVFQMSALFDSMSVYDNVAFPLREHTRLSRKEMRDRVMDRLGALGVAHAVNKQPSELSGGMRKRVAVARALVLEPAILIYDEPTTGLDPITSRTVDDLIQDTQRRFGVTQVVISHDMASVFHVADRINLLYKGKIVAAGLPNEFIDSRQPEVLEFLEASGVSTEVMRRGAAN